MPKAKVESKTKLSPFTILGDLNCATYAGGKPQKLYSEEQVKESGLNIYLLLTFIKNNNIGLQLAQYLNENWKIPFYQMYLITFFTFKRFKVSGVKWIKMDKGIKYDKCEVIQRYYHCNYLTSIEILRTLSAEELKRIESLYKTGGRNNI